MQPLAGRRILVVLDSLDLGGAERQALMHACWLRDQHGASLEMWGFGEPGLAARRATRLGLQWRALPHPWAAPRLRRPARLARFAATLRAARPDIVLPYATPANILCALTWRLAGVQLCIWNQRDEGLLRWHPLVQKAAVSRVADFIANSMHSASFLTGALAIDAGRIRIVRNGVQLDPPQSDGAAWRARLGIDDTTFVAAMVANVHGNKDHATLLHAWQIVLSHFADRNRKAVLLLAGRPSAVFIDLARLSDELGISESVRFPGVVEDVTGLLAATDVGVFSSRSESSPNALLEYMAAGLAVAATDIPAIRDALGDEVSHLTAPPGDAHALARRILMLEDPQVRRAIGSANRKRIAEHYDAGVACEAFAQAVTEAWVRR